MTHAPAFRAKSPTDLLALVPSLLGFHPQDSVVLLTVGDALTPFHARVDLPTDPVALEAVVAQLADVAGRSHASRVALVVYSDDAGLAEAVTSRLEAALDPGSRPGSRPGPRPGPHARRGSGPAGGDLVCAVRADGERWWPVGSDPDDPGTPYDLRSHPWTAQAVVAGRVVLGSRQELADSLVGTDAEEPERIAVIADDIAARLGGSRTRHAAREALVVEGRWVSRRVCRFLDDGRRLDAHDVARLCLLMTVSLEVRDVAWAEMSRDNAARHVDLWRDVARRAPVELRAAAASLLGFAAWLTGDGALAWCAVDRAQQAEPGYGLAGLLTQMLAGAMPPSAWLPFPRDSLTLFAG